MTISWNKKLLALVAAVCTVVLVTASVMTGWAVGYVRDARAASGGVADGDFPKIAAGYYHTLALAANGDLYAWGGNYHGQLGLGNNTSYNAPQHVSHGNRKYKAISAGYNFSLAIAENGDLYAWGLGYEGQLGNDDTFSTYSTPQQVSLGSLKYKAISAGYQHVLAISEAGDVYSWGANGNGQLGINGFLDKSAPTQVYINSEKYKAVSAGTSFSLALAENGNLYSWGNNADGQLGLGHYATCDVPQHVSAGTRKYRAISAGAGHARAIAENGDLYSWGQNGTGQLGLGNLAQQNTPQHVSAGGRKYRAIGGFHPSYAITEGGDLYSFGDNVHGRLGLGVTGGTYNTPQYVSTGFNKYNAVAGGGDGQTFAVTQDGDLFAWGNNSNGYLGLGHSNPGPNRPTYVPIILSKLGLMQQQNDLLQQQINAMLVSKDAPLAIAAGGGTSYAIAANGDLCSWGNASQGILGTGSTLHSTTPKHVNSGNRKYKAVATGGYHTLAIAENGDLYSWGQNNWTQLGYYSSDPHYEERPVAVNDGRKYKAIAVGTGHSLAIAENGDLYAWGSDANGVLGVGSTGIVTGPNHVNDGGRKYKAIAASMHNSFAIAENGDLYAWGDDIWGQLGQTSNMGSSSFPMHVASGSRKYKAISAGTGYDHVLAIAENGDLYAWGGGTWGQLGLGNPSHYNSPQHVSAGSRKYKEISAGPEFSLAIAENGDLYSWGSNNNGQLGLGNTSTGPLFPTHVSTGGLKYRSVAAGFGFCTAISENGDVYVWGQNTIGQLGLGTSGSGTSKTVPTINIGLKITVLLEKQVADLLAELNTVKGDYVTVTGQISYLQSIVGTSSGTGLRKQVTDLDALLNHPTTGLIKKVGDHTTALGTLPSAGTTIDNLISGLRTDTNNLLADMNTAGGKFDVLQTKVNTEAENLLELLGKHNTLNGIVTNASTGLQQKVGALETNGATKAELNTAIGGATTRLSTIETSLGELLAGGVDATVAGIIAEIEGLITKSAATTEIAAAVNNLYTTKIVPLEGAVDPTVLAKLSAIIPHIDDLIEILDDIEGLTYDDAAIWRGVAALQSDVQNLGNTYAEKNAVTKQIDDLEKIIATLQNSTTTSSNTLQTKIAELEALLNENNDKGRFTPIEIGAMIAGGTLLLGLIFVTILYRQAARDRKYLKLSKDAAFEQLSKGQ